MPATGSAATCGGTHTVAQGESLQEIGAEHYDSDRKWTVLYYANPELLGRDPTSIEAGTELSIPCLSGRSPVGDTAAALQKSKAEAEVDLLTGGNYAPFTSKDLPRNGLMTGLVKAALAKAPNKVTYSIGWNDDWSEHLDPMLLEHDFDAGFPWVKPNCSANPDNVRCRKFHFSEPLLEVLVQLFVRRGEGFAFDRDSAIHGKTLCRPKGYYIHDLDRRGRRWLSEDRIELVRPATPKACFEKLMAGKVDAVTLNEFLGRRVIARLQLGNQVKAMQRPVSVQSLHVVVPRTNPRAKAFLYRFNAGLQRLKQEDRYREIVKRQMSGHWSRL